MQDFAEEWKPVVGLEARYEVSNQGRVRSARTKRIKTLGRNSRGYTTVDLYVGDSRDKAFSVHTLVACAFLGQRPLGMEVNHKDGNKGNPAADNLEYLTHSANVRHAYETGLYNSKPGPKVGQVDREIGWSAHPRTLDEEKVRKIRELGKTMSSSAIAAIVGCHKGTAWAIVARKRWAHLH